MAEAFGPGLAGWYAADEARQRGLSNQIGQLGGLLGLKNAMFEQEMNPLKMQQLQMAIKKAVDQQEALRRIGGAGPSANATGATVPVFGEGGISTPGGGQASLVTGQTAAPQPQRQAVNQQDYINAIVGGVPEKAVQLIRDIQNPAMQVHGNYAYDPRNIRPGFLPSINTSQSGQTSVITIGPDGQPIVSAPRGALETYGGYKDVDARTAAKYDLVTVPPTGPNTPPTFQPRLGLLAPPGAQTQPQAAPQAAQGGFQIPPAVQAQRDVEAGRIRQAEVQPGGGGMIPSANVLPNAAGQSPSAIAVQAADAKYRETAATKGVERDMTQHEAVNSALENITKLDMVGRHLRESDALTGMGAELMRDVQRARQAVVADVKRGKQISDTQLLDAFLGSDVFPMIKALGIGARGLDTPAEREFLRQVMTGTITMDKQALIRLTDLRRDISTRVIEKWNERVQKGELDRYFEANAIKKEPIPVPSKQSGAPRPDQIPGQSTGRVRRYNPQTGRIE